jgi:hypothetical protein
MNVCGCVCEGILGAGWALPLARCVTLTVSLLHGGIKKECRPLVASSCLVCLYGVTRVCLWSEYMSRVHLGIEVGMSCVTLEVFVTVCSGPGSL